LLTLSGSTLDPVRCQAESDARGPGAPPHGWRPRHHTVFLCIVMSGGRGPNAQTGLAADPPAKLHLAPRLTPPAAGAQANLTDMDRGRPAAPLAYVPTHAMGNSSLAFGLQYRQLPVRCPPPACSLRQIRGGSGFPARIRETAASPGNIEQLECPLANHRSQLLGRASLTGQPYPTLAWQVTATSWRRHRNWLVSGLQCRPRGCPLNCSPWASRGTRVASPSMQTPG